MKPKVLVTMVLLVFVATAVAYLAIEETRKAGKLSSNPASSRGPSESVGRPEGIDRVAGVAQPAARDTARRADRRPNSGKGAAPGAGTTAPTAEVQTAAPVSRPVVIAYYFHATQRCATCRKLEAYSQEAIAQGFPGQLRDGSLVWRVVNTDEPENKHFVDDYKLYTRSLVIVKTADGRQTDWKNLEKIWDLVDDKPGFLDYVQREIAAYLGTTSR